MSRMFNFDLPSTTLAGKLQLQGNLWTNTPSCNTLYILFLV